MNALAENATDTEICDWIAETWAEVIRDRPELNIWQWSAQNIVFTSKMGNITGPWRPDLTPYTLLFQEAITNHFTDIPEEDWFLRDIMLKGQRVDECFVVKSSQSGLTQAALNACAYLPLFDPGRLLYVIDSQQKAKRMVKTRLIPLLEALCGAVIADDKDVNLTFIELLDMIMEFSGSFSAGIFSEKPLRFGFLDDVEYMVAEGGIPGMLDGVHVIDHIRSRFTTSDNSFLGVFSKPNLESSDFISNARGGSLHAFFVPCPHCGKRQKLTRQGLNWSHKGCKDLAGRYDLSAVEELTTYRCVHCKKDIQEDAKYEMNKAGIWIPKSREQRLRDEDPPLVPRRLSMEINDLYSPFPKVKWGILARLEIEAQNNPAKLKHVRTNHFAEPWRERAVNIKAEQVRALCAGAISEETQSRIDLRVAPYQRGEIPFIPALMTITIDRQLDKKKWIVSAWKSDGTQAIVEYGASLSDEDILEMLDNPKAHHGGPLVCLADPTRPIILNWGLYDSGFERDEVYKLCIRSDWRIYPSKGAGGLSSGGRLVEGKEDFWEGTTILYYQYHDYHLKSHFYKGKVERRIDPRLYLPEDVTDEFVLEWTTESLAPKYLSTGYKIMDWVHDKSKGPNDWGDAAKMQCVLWQILGPSIQQQAAQEEGRAVRQYELKPLPDAQPELPSGQPSPEALIAAVEDAHVTGKPSLAEMLARLRG